MTDVHSPVNFTPRAIEILREQTAASMSIEPAHVPMDEVIQVTQINVLNFLNYYKRSPFLISEVVHPFNAIEFYAMDNPNDKIEVKLCLVLSETSILVLAPDEIQPVDEMYDVRKLIAEAGMPEFYNDQA